MAVSPWSSAASASASGSSSRTTWPTKIWLASQSPLILTRASTVVPYRLAILESESPFSTVTDSGTSITAAVVVAGGAVVVAVATTVVATLGVVVVAGE